MIYEQSDSAKKTQLYHENDNNWAKEFYSKRSTKINLTKSEDKKLVKKSSKEDTSFLNEDYVLLYKTSNKNEMLMVPAKVGKMGLNIRNMCNGCSYTLIGYFSKEGDWVQKGSGEISDSNLIKSKDSELFPITNRKYHRDKFLKGFYNMLEILNIIALIIGAIKIDPAIILVNMTTLYFWLSYEELSAVKCNMQDFAKVKREYKYFSQNIETKEIWLEQTIGVNFYKKPIIIWLSYETSQEILKDIVSCQCLNSFRYYKQIHKVKIYNIQNHVIEKWKSKYPYFVNSAGEIVIFAM